MLFRFDYFFDGTNVNLLPKLCHGIYYYKIQNDYLSLIRQEVISNPNLKIGNDFGNQSTATEIEYYFDPVNRNYVIREGSKKKFIICGERVLRYDFICISKTCTNKYCNDNCENSCNQPTVRKYYHYFGLRCIEAQYVDDPTYPHITFLAENPFIKISSDSLYYPIYLELISTNPDRYILTYGSSTVKLYFFMIFLDLYIA